MNIVVKKTTNEEEALLCEYHDDPNSIGYSRKVINMFILAMYVFGLFEVSTKDKRCDFKEMWRQYLRERRHIEWYRDLKKLRKLGYLKIYRENNRNVYEIKKVEI